MAQKGTTKLNQQSRTLQVYTFVLVIVAANALRATLDGFSEILKSIQDWQRWTNIGAQAHYVHPVSPISVLFMSLFSLVVSWTFVLFVWTVRSELAQRVHR